MGDHPINRTTTKAEILVMGLHEAFGYTTDNNRDLIADSSFPLEDALEEIAIEAAYKTLVAAIQHDAQGMFETNLEDWDV